MGKSQLKNREKYVDKIVNEFIEKDWNLKELLGRRNLNNISKSKQSYEKFKKDVLQYRSFKNERKKLSHEIDNYKNRITNDEKVIKHKNEIKKVKEVSNDRYVKTQLLKFYPKDIARKIYQKASALGLKKHDFKDKRFIQNKISFSFMDSITNEITYIKNGETKTHGGFFRNVSELKIVKDVLTNINNKLLTDDNAVLNSTKLVDYLYNTLIPMKYEGDNPSYSKIKRADVKFWKDVSKKLEIYYDEIREDV